MKFDSIAAAEKIKVDQQIFMIAPTLRAATPGKQISMDVYDFAVNQNIPKYIIHIIDSNDKPTLGKRSCAAFIVPTGKESESTYATEMGR